MLPQTYLPSRNQYAPSKSSSCISRALMSSGGSWYWLKIVHWKLFTDLFFEGVVTAEFHFNHTTTHLTDQVVDDRWLSCALFWSRTCRFAFDECAAFRLREICYHWFAWGTCRLVLIATTCRRCGQIACLQYWQGCWSAFSWFVDVTIHEFASKANR